MISILVPALSRAREVARRTQCGSNLRQIGIAMLQYATDNNGWLPLKSKPGSPQTSPHELTFEQQKATSQYGPDLSGIVRDVIERRHTRESGDPDGRSSMPQYLPSSKVLLCPSDKYNNQPNQPAIPPDGWAPPLSIGQLWPTQEVNQFADLPRTLPQAATAKKTYISYVYVALLRNDDRGDFFLMSDQSNTNDARTNFSVYWTPEDNHATRGVNAMFVDSHVEWTQMRGGDFESAQDLARRIFGTLSSNRSRYNVDQPNRASEIATVE